MWQSSYVLNLNSCMLLTPPYCCPLLPLSRCPLLPTAAHCSLCLTVRSSLLLPTRQVDVRTRDTCGWTALGALTCLRNFEFVEWNNPVLSVGNLAVLTDESVVMMANSWRTLERLRYGWWLAAWWADWFCWVGGWLVGWLVGCSSIFAKSELAGKAAPCSALSLR